MECMECIELVIVNSVLSRNLKKENTKKQTKKNTQKNTVTCYKKGSGLLALHFGAQTS